MFNAFDLMAVLTLDSSQYDKGLDEAGESAKGISSKIGGALKTVGKVSAGAIAAGSAAVVGLTKSAVSAYADYEQLAGGVETLFGTGGKTLDEFAASAKATATDIENSGVDWKKYFGKAWMSEGDGINGLFEEIQYNIDELGASADEVADYLHFEYDLDTEDAQKAIQAYYDAVSPEKIEAKFESMGRAQETVLKNADNAYKTAGLSVNEYIETVTSFAAALNQSVGGDTEKAAAMADLAITDMSDNANKMGTAMESIQNAYNGFAKQNFTMLDNLKLGYGGTKEEMERLLADAEKLSGQEFDISSYADIVEAIHVVQTEMGITGTTAKEASETISGSLNMTKSAWTNLIAGLGNDNADLDGLIDNFVDSLDKLGDNIFPIIEKVLDGIVKLVDKLAPKLANRLPGLIQKILPKLWSAITKLAVTLAKNLPGLIQTLLPPLLSGIIQIGAELIKNLPAILMSIFEAVMVTLAELWGQLGEWFMSMFPGLTELFGNAWEAIKGAFAAVGEFFSEIWGNITGAFSGAIEWFSSLFSDAWDAIKKPFEAIGDWFDKRWTDIQNVFRNIGTWFGKVFEGARDAIEKVWRAVVNIVKMPVNALIGLLNIFIRGLNKIKVPDWVPAIGGYGIHIPEIPELAEGGILKKGQLGLLEGNGTEAVVPLDQNRKWVQSIVAEMRKLGGGISGDIVIPVSIGTRRLETIVIEANKLNNYRSGGRA